MEEPVWNSEFKYSQVGEWKEFMLGQVSMPCVLRIKGSLFCPATFLEVTGLFWLQLLRTLSLNSGHTTSAQKVHRHKGFLSNQVQCAGKLQVLPKVNWCFFSIKIWDFKFACQNSIWSISSFSAGIITQPFYFSPSSLLNKRQSCYT